MGTRIVVGLLLLAVVLPIVIYGGFWGLSAMMTVVAAFSIYEFAGLIRPPLDGYSSTPPGGRWDMLGFELVAGLGLFWAVALLGPRLPLALVALVMSTALFHLIRFQQIERAGKELVGSLASIFYAPLLLSTVPLLGSQQHGVKWLFFMMFCTWGGDTGAYFAGRFFGKHKLAPTVSPGKTLEGLIGGVVAVVALIVAFKLTFFPELTWVHCFVLAPLTDLAGVAGDLVESLLKRTAKIKDSGTLFPGHGGMLDRIDSLLFTTPVVYAWVTF